MYATEVALSMSLQAAKLCDKHLNVLAAGYFAHSPLLIKITRNPLRLDFSFMSPVDTMPVAAMDYYG